MGQDDEYDLDSQDGLEINPDTFSYRGLTVTPLPIEMKGDDFWNPYPEQAQTWWTCEITIPWSEVGMRLKPKLHKEWAINESKSFIDNMVRAFPNKDVTLSHQYMLIVGDYSQDGHGKKTEFHFRSSHDEDAIHAAYYEAVRKSGVGLHQKQDEKFHKAPPIKFDEVLVDYQESKISGDQMDRLIAIGVDPGRFPENNKHSDGDYYFNDDVTACLFLEMVRCQLPGFEYEFIAPKAINGWNPKFRHQFGYGVFD